MNNFERNFLKEPIQIDQTFNRAPVTFKTMITKPKLSGAELQILCQGLIIVKQK